MIEVWSWPTPNGHKVHIALEELGLEYKVIPVNIGAGDQFKSEFLKITANHRIPAIVDTDRPGGKPFTLFESAAILIYLSEKTGGKLIPKDPFGRYKCLEWIMFQMGGVGPMFGQCCAVLLSTLRISLTWGPLGPGPARTSSVAPGGTLLWPLRSTTLTCKKASPDPLASCTKPNPLSALYHLTTAWTGGPGGVSNLWMLDPDVDPKLRRGVSKLSSSKSRRRVGRKSLSLLLT